MIMAKVYAELIRKGRKTIDDVPEHLVDEVRMLGGEKLMVATSRPEER